MSSKHTKEKLERLIKESLLQICKSNVQSLCEVDGIICISIQDTNSEPEQLVIRIHENLKTSRNFITHHKNVPYMDPSMKNKLEFLSSDQASALKLYLSSSSSALSSFSTDADNTAASPRLGYAGMRPLRQVVINNAHTFNSGLLTHLVKKHGNSTLLSNSNNSSSSNNTNNYVFNLSTNRDRNVPKLSEDISSLYGTNNQVDDLSLKNKLHAPTTSTPQHQSIIPASSAAASSSFACGLCLRSFLTYDSLEVHFSSFHSSILTHFCDDCNIGFESEMDCSTHRLSVHKAKFGGGVSASVNKNINNYGNNIDQNNFDYNNNNYINNNKPHLNATNAKLQGNVIDYNNNNKNNDDEDDDDTNDDNDFRHNHDINNSTSNNQRQFDASHEITNRASKTIKDDLTTHLTSFSSSSSSPQQPSANTNRRKQSNPKKGIAEWDKKEALEEEEEEEEEPIMMIDEGLDEEDEDNNDDDDDDGGGPNMMDSSCSTPTLKIAECNNNTFGEADRNLIAEDNNNNNHTFNLMLQKPNDDNRRNIINFTHHQQQQQGSESNKPLQPSATSSSSSSSSSSLKCPLCSEPFGTFNQLEEHCYVEHRKYLCNICPMTFSQKVTKDRHIYQQHAGNKPFPCGDCDSSFTRRDALRKHQVKCSHGSYNNNNNNNNINGGDGGGLKIVIQKSGGGEFSTNGINMISVVNKSLLGRDVDVSEDAVAVDYSKLKPRVVVDDVGSGGGGSGCGLDLSRSSSSPGRLKFISVSRRLLAGNASQQHVEGEIVSTDEDASTNKMTPSSFHSYDVTIEGSNTAGNGNTSASLPASPSPLNNNNSKQYNCDKCEYVCEGALSYKEHCRLVHRRTPCLHCGKTFSQKGNMERHRRQHTGERPFSCTLCSCSYTRRETLKSHMSQAHGIRLLPQVPNSSGGSGGSTKGGVIKTEGRGVMLMTSDGFSGDDRSVAVDNGAGQVDDVYRSNVIFEITPIKGGFREDGYDNDTDGDASNDVGDGGLFNFQDEVAMATGQMGEEANDDDEEEDGGDMKIDVDMTHNDDDGDADDEDGVSKKSPNVNLTNHDGDDGNVYGNVNGDGDNNKNDDGDGDGNNNDDDDGDGDGDDLSKTKGKKLIGDKMEGGNDDGGGGGDDLGGDKDSGL